MSLPSFAELVLSLCLRSLCLPAATAVPMQENISIYCVSAWCKAMQAVHPCRAERCTLQGGTGLLWGHCCCLRSSGMEGFPRDRSREEQITA